MVPRMEPRGDKPRRIVVCHPSELVHYQRTVAALGHGDVLVKPSRYVEPGSAYVMNPPPDVIELQGVDR